MLITAACNWIEIDITQSLFLYSIEKKKKWKLRYGINLFLKIGFVNLYEYVAILLIFSPLSGFPSVQISSIAAGATVYYYQLDNNKKRYMTYNTYTVGFFNLIIVLIWQLFLLNFLEILVSCQRRETVQSYSP